MGAGNHNKSAVVEYANDIDTSSYQSGFPLKAQHPSISAAHKGVEAPDCPDMFSTEVGTVK